MAGPAASTRLADDVVLASGVAAGQAGAHPVESPVVAVERAIFTAVGGCPQVGDAYALPALCAEAARHGRVTAVRECVVMPASRKPGPPRHDRARGPELSIVIPTLDAAGERVGVVPARDRVHDSRRPTR